MHFAIYNLQYTMYIVPCTMYSVHCIRYILPYALCTIQCGLYCAIYAVQCSLYIVHQTIMYNVQRINCTMYIVHRTSVHRTTYIVHLYNVQCQSYHVSTIPNELLYHVLLKIISSSARRPGTHTHIFSVLSQQAFSCLIMVALQCAFDMISCQDVCL